MLFLKNAAQPLQCMPLCRSHAVRTAVHLFCNLCHRQLAEKESLDYLAFLFPQILQAVPHIAVPLRLQNQFLRFITVDGQRVLPFVVGSLCPVVCFVMDFPTAPCVLPVNLVL